ncbi:hypothetical protein GEMRC1_003896 [Eukaryota sp. GEM-RC1]
MSRLIRQACINPNVTDFSLLENYFLSESIECRSVPFPNCLIVQRFSNYQFFFDSLLNIHQSCTTVNSVVLSTLIKESQSDLLLSFSNLFKSGRSLFSIALLNHQVSLHSSLTDSSSLELSLPHFGCSIVDLNPSLIISTRPALPNIPTFLPSFYSSYLKTLSPAQPLDLSTVPNRFQSPSFLQSYHPPHWS